MSHSVEILDLIEHGNVEQIRYYLGQYPQYNIQATNQSGQNLLHIVLEKSRKNMLEMIQLFLNKGLDPAALDDKFISPMDLAQQKNYLGVASILSIKKEERQKEELALFLEINK